MVRSVYLHALMPDVRGIGLGSIPLEATSETSDTPEPSEVSDAGGARAQEPILVRPMRERDLLGVVEVDREAFPTHWSLRSFREELENRSALYLVAERRGRILGFAGMWLLHDEAHITLLGVRRDLRRRGIATLLLAELLRRAIDLGAVRATLEVRVSNIAARGLYAKFGFTQHGLRPKYYCDTGEDALILWLDDLATSGYQERLESWSREARERLDACEGDVPQGDGAA